MFDSAPGPHLCDRLSTACGLSPNDAEVVPANVISSTTLNKRQKVWLVCSRRFI